MLVKAQMLQALLHPLTRKGTANMVLCPGLVFLKQIFFCNGNDLAVQMRDLQLTTQELIWSFLPFLKQYSPLLSAFTANEVFLLDIFLLIWGSHVLSFCNWIMLPAEFVHLLASSVTPMSAEKAAREHLKGPDTMGGKSCRYVGKCCCG